MQHPEPADLAVLALGDHLDEDGLYEHVIECDVCSAELDDLRAVVARATTDSSPGRGPSPAVWAAIVAEVGPDLENHPESARMSPTFADPVMLGASEDNSVLDGVSIPVDPAAVRLRRRDEIAAQRRRSSDRPARRAGIAADSAGPRQAGPSGQTGPTVVSIGDRTPATPPGPDAAGLAGGGASGRSAPRRRWVPLVAAAAVGLLIGGGVVALVQRGTTPTSADPAVLASTPLTPVDGGQLAGQTDRTFGTAQVLAADGTQWVSVSGAELPPTSDAYEVWLIGADDRMVALGALHDGSGTFTIPTGIDYTQYPVVDISAEPPDGVPTHSGDSLVRGLL